MTGEIHVALTRFERKLIRERCEVPAAIRDLMADDRPRTESVLLTRSQVDTLREAVADELQRSGFDDEWNANLSGQALEQIIDKLQPPDDA